MANFCPLLTEEWASTHFWSVTFVIFFLVSLVIINKIIKIKKTKFAKIALALALSIAIALPLAFLLSFSNLLFLEGLDNPVASLYFPLNAAIKNTCYLDLTKTHCPKNLDELIAIEPENFKPLLWGKKANYWYYPDSNEYTLIIKHDWMRGVIFDPKLQTFGTSDFVDLTYCTSNPPVPLWYQSSISLESWSKFLETRSQIKF